MSKEKKSGKITVFDIAKALNISASTVSRSLNNHSNISNKTKKRVLTMAKKMGYGMGLKYKEAKSIRKLIALVIPSLDSTFYIEYAKFLQTYLDRFDYNLVIYSTNNNHANERKIAEQLTQFKIAGVVVCLTSESEDSRSFKVLDDYNIPWIMFDQVDSQSGKIKISVDNVNATIRAVSHLIGNGYKRIAHLAGHPNSSKFSGIVEGYKLALVENNIELNNDYIIYSDLTKEDVTESLHRLLSLETPPNAIIIGSSDASLEVVHFLKNNSIEIPNDIALVSYSFEKSLQYTTPSISHVQIPVQKLAQTTSEILINLLRYSRIDSIDNKLSAKFIIRKSSMSF
jgi:LacI family transcriptional regulator